MPLVFCALMAIACLDRSALTAKAQAPTVRVSVVSLSPAVVRVDGDLRRASDVWSFPNIYGPVSGLGERIANFGVTDGQGNSVTVRRLDPADFKSEKPVSHFRYDVRVSAPLKAADQSHVSWLKEQGGYLMLADLLPTDVATRKPDGALRVEFLLPPHWDIVSSVQAKPTGAYEVIDPALAVFFVGKDLRVKHKQIGRTDFLFASLGDWPFPRDSVTHVVGRVLKDYGRIVGFDAPARAVLMLVPGNGGAEQWTAETRGANIVLALGRNSPTEVLLGRLSIILTHELFHLWVPGALSLTGDYAWFYEGFTLYQALRCAVRLGFINFQEYLSTMARVYNSYRATVERDQLSLLEASQSRWTMNSSLVYDKGMLLAFLCDLRLRAASRNRHSLDDLYRDLFREQEGGEGRDGSSMLINLLDRLLGGEQFARQYISTPGAVTLETELPTYGLVIESTPNISRLQVGQSLSNEQRELLQSLGYRRPRQ